MINDRPEGTTFCLKAGVYRLATGILVKSSDRIIGEPGTVLDGQGAADRGLYGFGGETGQHDVVVRGVALTGFTDAAIQAGLRWTIRKTTARKSNIGVRVNTGTVLRGNHIHHNRQYGIVGGPVSNVLIVANEVAYNNTSNSCGGGCAADAGGSKIFGSTAGSYGVTWRGNWVHHNVGNGIWSDGNVHDVVYEDNLVERNSGIGILHEISWDAVVRDNVVRANNTEQTGKSCFWGAQIDINTSQNVEIYGNKVSSGVGANGICLNAATRSVSSPFPTSLATISVHHNKVRLSGSSMTGLVGNSANGISFDWNTYDVTGLDAQAWAWNDEYPLSWSEFRSRGQEAHGTRS